jgi:hypothetical protein
MYLAYGLQLPSLKNNYMKSFIFYYDELGLCVYHVTIRRVNIIVEKVDKKSKG